MKIKILSFVFLVTLWFSLPAQAQTGGTPFYCQLLNPDGSPQTNIVTMQVWPPDVNAFTVYGTNIVFAGTIYTNTPSLSGFFTNRLYPNKYVVRIPSAGRFFYVNLLDTPLYLSLAQYATNVASVNNPLSFYGIVTNWLGFAPATNSLAGIDYLKPGIITNLAGIDAKKPGIITNLAGIDAAKPGIVTNLATLDAVKPGIITNLTLALVDAAKPSIITNLAGIDAVKPGLATNYATAVTMLGFAPLTNTWNSFTNFVIQNGGVSALQGYVSATNTSSMLIAGLGYVPANITNVAGVLNAGPGMSIVTNGIAGKVYTLWITTNLATGVAPAFTAPNGSFLSATNGWIYMRTNDQWKGILTQ